MNGEGSADDAATAKSSHAATLEEPDAESAESPTTAAASDAAAVVEAEERPPVKAPDALGGGQQTMAERMRAEPDSFRPFLVNDAGGALEPEVRRRGGWGRSGLTAAAGV